PISLKEVETIQKEGSNRANRPIVRMMYRSTLRTTLMNLRFCNRPGLVTLAVETFPRMLLTVAIAYYLVFQHAFFRKTKLSIRLIENPTVRQLELDARKDQDDEEQHPGKGRGIAHMHVIKGLAIDIEHCNHGIIGGAAVGHNKDRSKAA